MRLLHKGRPAGREPLAGSPRGPQLIDELLDAAHRREGRNTKDLWVFEIEYAFVLVLREQRIKHGAGLWTVFGKHIPLAHLLRLLAPCQRRPVECDVADEIERI
jgi:hypothetical protein